jgi:hypothetical protein
LESPQTVIHGEFYAKTLLLRRGQIFILDWESAAIAAGEIDLAALTEGLHWPEPLVRRCERCYLKARWPHGPPTSFVRAFCAAKIYLHFRWLGERPEWAVRPKNLWRYQRLHRALKDAELI